MKEVYLMQHLMVYEDYEDTKFIGVYSSYENAVRAVEHLITQPGFSKAPDIIDPLEDEGSGFIIEPWKIDKTTWLEGFGW